MSNATAFEILINGSPTAPVDAVVAVYANSIGLGAFFTFLILGLASAVYYKQESIESAALTIMLLSGLGLLTKGMFSYGDISTTGILLFLMGIGIAILITKLFVRPT